MQPQRIDGLIPSFLDNGPPIFRPPLGNLQPVDHLLAFQPRQRYLFVNIFESLDNCLDVMRGVLLVRDAGDAKQRIVAGKADDAQFLLRMDLAEDLIEA